MFSETHGVVSIVGPENPNASIRTSPRKWCRSNLSTIQVLSSAPLGPDRCTQPQYLPAGSKRPGRSPRDAQACRSRKGSAGAEPPPTRSPGSRAPSTAPNAPPGESRTTPGNHRDPEPDDEPGEGHLQVADVLVEVRAEGTDLLRRPTYVLGSKAELDEASEVADQEHYSVPHEPYAREGDECSS